jgi:hypothetical protein
MKEQEPSVPVKKKPNAIKKPTLIKYGSGYADQGLGGSKIRTVFKDFDEAKEKPKRNKTLKEFMEDAGTNKIPTKQDRKNIEYMQQVFLAGKNTENFEDFIGFVNYIS